jgi:NADH dehydrogenase [ubiquinone] 1 alpha subcomplex assembly factor 5
MIVPQPAQRGGSAKSRSQRAQSRAFANIARLSPSRSQRTSAAMSLFDPDLRAMRRDRAARIGVELFLYERAFADCLERVALIQQRFRSALLIGCPDRHWPERLGGLADKVAVLEPGPLFARTVGGEPVVEDLWQGRNAAFDLCMAIGTLDTVSDLPRALATIRGSLTPGALFIGAMSGGDTLPQLRSAMRAADQVAGAAVPHVHPRIEAAALAPLLAEAGFVMPVVDVDRARVSYASLDRLVADVRAMGATNILSARSRRPLSKVAVFVAMETFAAAGTGGRTEETFEMLHFAAWTAQTQEQG